MATAKKIITRSLRLIGVLAAGETATAEDLTDSLEALNDMLDGWRADSMMVYALRDESVSMTGAQSYTAGAGGDLNTDRPVRIESAYLRTNGTDYPLRLAAASQWNRLSDKSVAGDVPDWLYYETSHPLGRLWLYPYPASGVLHVSTWVPLGSFAADDDVDLPPGYREMLGYQLAMRLAPEYGKSASAEVVAMAAASKDRIGNINFRVPTMDAGLSTGRRFDIMAGN